MNATIDLPVERIGDFCRRNHIAKLSVFGSALHDNFRPDSDVDILVELEPGQVPGFAFFAMQDELSAIIGHTVDLHTPGFLSRYFRDDVMRDAEVVYGG